MISSGGYPVRIKFDNKTILYTDSPLRMVVLQYDEKRIRLQVEDGEVSVAEIDRNDGRAVTITTEFSVLEF